MADLAQFWRDNPRYNGRYKEPAEFGIKYGTGGQSGVLAASAVAQQADIAIGKDADFIVTSATACQTTANTDAAYITTPLIAAVFYSSAQRNITSIKLEWSNVFAILNSFTPNQYWSYPLVLPMANQLSVFLDNPLAVAANVYIAFQGIKVFPFPSERNGKGAVGGDAWYAQAVRSGGDR